MVKQREGAILIALGLLIGIVFGVLSPRWYAPIERADAVSETLEFESWSRLRNRRGGFTGAKLTFSNGKTRLIDEDCMTQAVSEKLDALETGAEIQLFTRADGTILSLNANGERILDFDFAQERLAEKGTQYKYIGAFGFVCAGAGMVHIIRKKSARR